MSNAKTITELYNLVKGNILSVGDALHIFGKLSPSNDHLKVFSLLLSNILTLETALEAITITTTTMPSPPITSSSSSSLSSVPSLVCMSLSSFVSATRAREASLKEEDKKKEEGTVITYHYDGRTKKNERWEIDGKLHRVDGPAVLEYDEDGQKIREEWFQNNLLHRLNKPARILYDSKGLVTSEHWYEHGIPPTGTIIQKLYNPYGGITSQCTKTFLLGGSTRTSWFLIKVDGTAVLHSTTGPAVLEYDEDGLLLREIWYRNGLKHRSNSNPTDGPTEIEYFPNGIIKTKIWYKDGLFDTSHVCLFNYLSFYDDILKIKSGWTYDLEGNIQDGQSHVSYYKSGNKKLEQTFGGGKLLSTISYDESGMVM